MTTSQINLHPILCEEPLHILYSHGASDQLVVVFSGVGDKPHDVQPVEFCKSATQNGRHPTLFIRDFSRSWLNHGNIYEQLVSIICRTAQVVRAKGVHLIGNSMGGTMALMLKDAVKATTVLSFVPQFSVRPDLVPEETRWMRYRNQIETFKYPHVDLERTPGQSVWIIHGGTDDERIHADRFPDIHGIRHFVIPDYGHNVCTKLKRKDNLEPLIRAALQNKPVRLRSILERHGGVYINALRSTGPSTRMKRVA